MKSGQSLWRPVVGNLKGTNTSIALHDVGDAGSVPCTAAQLVAGADVEGLLYARRKPKHTETVG